MAYTVNNPNLLLRYYDFFPTYVKKNSNEAFFILLALHSVLGSRCLSVCLSALSLCYIEEKSKYLVSICPSPTT